MKKVALSLLVVFAAFVWACDDGLDDRASLGTAQVSVRPQSTTYQYDLLSWDNSSGTCVESLKTEGSFQAFDFSVWLNPIYKGEISRVKVIKVESKYHPITNGAPALPSKSYHTSTDLYNNVDFSPSTISYTASNVTFPLFDDGEMVQILYAFTVSGKTPITYVVDYKFTLLELSTGIEEVIFANSIRVTFADYVTDNNCQ
jgi:hypothetical protein